MKILRSIGGVVAGAIVAFVGVVAGDGLSYLLFLPPGTDLTKPDVVKDLAAKMPTGAFLCILAGYVVGTLLGSWLAAKIAGRAHIVHGLVVGALPLAGAIFNMATIPHPLWFNIATVVAFPAAAFLGGLFARGKGVC